jgi:hypothetical protein
MASGNVLAECRAATYFAAPSERASSSLTPPPPCKGGGAATSRTGRRVRAFYSDPLGRGRGPVAELVNGFSENAARPRRCAR